MHSDDADLVLATRLDVPVLISGDSATARYDIACRLHQQAPGAAGPWVAVNADADLEAAFSRAAGGTLFIDDIGALTRDQQARLTTLLDARRRTGTGAAPIARTARLVVGAAPSLTDEVGAGRFPEQLFYRLNVIRLDATALTAVRPVTVRDVMSSPVHACQPGTDLAAVAQIMWNRDCGSVPVVDAGRVVGIVTDRDICIATATRRLLPDQIAAREVMTAAPLTCLAGDRLEDALATMSRAQVHRLPVIDAQGRLVGLLSVNDVVRVAAAGRGPDAETILQAVAAIGEPRTAAIAVA